MAAILDSDAPADDGNACTAETCVNGIPSHPAEPARTACTQSGGTLCNGSPSAPACVVCLLATDCPGTDTDLPPARLREPEHVRVLERNGGNIGRRRRHRQLPKAVCDDMGGVTSAPDDTDVPADDGNTCTDDVCASGAPVAPAEGRRNGLHGAERRQSVQRRRLRAVPRRRRTAPGRTRFAASSSARATTPAATSTPRPERRPGTDATGNCHKAVCDGAGAVMSAVDDTDKPVDGNSCTGDVCTNGTPSNPNLPAGTLCTTTASAPDGSKVCDGSAACNPITFRVVRVGTGGTALSDASTAVVRRGATGSTAASWARVSRCRSAATARTSR